MFFCEEIHWQPYWSIHKREGDSINQIAMNAVQQHSSNKLASTMAIENLEDFLGSSGKERAVRETIQHEISLVTARVDTSESSEDLDFVYDLIAISCGDKQLNEAGCHAKGYCGGRGKLNEMLRFEAGDIETGMEQYLAFYVNMIDETLQSPDEGAINLNGQ